MTVKEHYDNHLGHFYSWMTGDVNTKSEEFKRFLTQNFVKPLSNKIAIDLGAGHGLQSIPLAQMGFQVIAVDFNSALLNELKINAKDLNIRLVCDDIKKVATFATKPELILCCGDTLLHLSSKSEIKTFIDDIAKSLDSNGKLILSFRDYSVQLTGTDRFIFVKGDDSKILTCILDYEDNFVNVTDLLYEKLNNLWQQKVSSYKKVRLTTNELFQYLECNEMAINFNQVVNGLTTIIATKR